MVKGRLFWCRLVPGADLSKGIYQKPRTRAPTSEDRFLLGGATCVANLVGILMILA